MRRRREVPVTPRELDYNETGATGRLSRRDRRAREVVITPKGRRRLERARQKVLETEDQVLAGLNARERDQLVTLLRRALEAAPAQPLWRAAEAD
jgi:uncharacterized protein (UPF0548 family)